MFQFLLFWKIASYEWSAPLIILSRVHIFVLRYNETQRNGDVLRAACCKRVPMYTECRPIATRVLPLHRYASSGVARILLQGARARGAWVPKFVALTKSSRSESHLALGLQKRIWLKFFATACHSNSNQCLNMRDKPISTNKKTAAKFCLHQTPGGHVPQCPMPGDATVCQLCLLRRPYASNGRKITAKNSFI